MNLIFIFLIWSVTKYIGKEQYPKDDVNEIKTKVLQSQQPIELTENLMKFQINQDNLPINDKVVQEEQIISNRGEKEENIENKLNYQLEQGYEIDKDKYNDYNYQQSLTPQSQFHEQDNLNQMNIKKNQAEQQQKNDLQQYNLAEQQQQDNDQNNSKVSHKNNPILPNEILGKILENIPITNFKSFELINTQKILNSFTRKIMKKSLEITTILQSAQQQKNKEYSFQLDVIWLLRFQMKQKIYMLPNKVQMEK